MNREDVPRQAGFAPLTSNYKGFPTFVKRASLVVNRATIDHET
ncbi:hypothetical protein [Rhodoferax sp.]|nr:hypothetical protein [Rhodoferax sp.]